MGEEFDESEVTFADVEAQSIKESHNELQHHKLETKRKKKKHSAPITIPKNISHVRYVESDLFEDDYEFEKIVPPHVILARRVAREVGFSFCTEYRKALTGKDLIQVRDLIFRLLKFD
uniref:uncharacterized protein LOC122597164 n=1 Tax=Erigeron canadensis TaxID=72917 RepID=UPI001CB92DA4|nr:uncharacterized protein LOC122597164 [Erigeron canadensis]